MLDPCFDKFPWGPMDVQTGLAGLAVDSTIGGDSRMVESMVEPRRDQSGRDQDQDRFPQVVVPGNRACHRGLIVAVVLHNNSVDRL